MTKPNSLRSKRICRTSTARKNDEVRGGRRSSPPAKPANISTTGCPSQEPGTATRVGGAGANPGFWRHRDGNGHEQHGLPSTAIYNPLYAPPYAAHTEESV